MSGRGAIEVPPVGHYFGGLFGRFPRAAISLGNLETWALMDELKGLRIDRPIYIAGLARAGTTVALEILAAHPDVASHRYCDYPPVFTPYWWNWFLKTSGLADATPVERAHRDGMLITPRSPEAMEEVIWMAFFDHLHDPAKNCVLDANTTNSAFERFYRNHVGKVLLSRRAQRYLAKGNYNVTRFAYLQSIFPDARFVVPVRDPVWHVASLMKQHSLFLAASRDNPRVAEHLRRVGHFEFGPGFRPINVGDGALVRSVIEQIARGEAARGWARYWNSLYVWLRSELDRSPELAAATMWLRYEGLCREPQDTIRRLLLHCGLPVNEDMIERHAARVGAPAYYRPSFAEHEIRAIREETADAAKLLGYTDQVTVQNAG